MEDRGTDRECAMSRKKERDDAGWAHESWDRSANCGKASRDGVALYVYGIFHTHNELKPRDHMGILQGYS